MRSGHKYVKGRVKRLIAARRRESQRSDRKGNLYLGEKDEIRQIPVAQ